MRFIQLLVFRYSKPTASSHHFTVNIMECHWLVHQPITPLPRPRYYTDCPTARRLCLSVCLSSAQLSHFVI